MPRLSCTRLAVAGQGRGGLLRDAILATATTATLAHIAAVEAEDGQRLEDGVLAAMVSFANWRIPLGGVCVFPFGARTLAGAWVSMVGPAPTLYNFVNDDYGRLTGTQGNAIDKFVDTGYAHNANAQNSRHAGVYFVSQPSGTSSTGLGAGTTGGSGRLWLLSTPPGPAIMTRLSDAASSFSVASVPTEANLLAASRSSSATVDYIHDGVTGSVSQTSLFPISSNVLAFARGTVAEPSSLSGAAIGAYTMGAAIDLVELDSRVRAAVAAITTALS